MALSKESSSGYSPEGQGFSSQQPENLELSKVKLQQTIETTESDLEKAQQRLETAKTDEMIDPIAAQNLVDQLQDELKDLHAEWETKFGQETSH
jgi:hypothetical protein